MVSNARHSAVATSRATDTSRLTPLQPMNMDSSNASNLVPLRPNTVKPSGLKAVWFLGGNHVVKLLTSVEGDFDEQVLSKLAEVSRDVGELALSVESLVSDDVTVGGFEDDLLAKIAKNTITARRASRESTSAVETSNGVAQNPSSPLPGVSSTPGFSGSVPNPLSSYESIPNPLARITPPASPIHTTESDNQASSKRKEMSPQAIAVTEAKRLRTNATSSSVVAHSNP